MYQRWILVTALLLCLVVARTFGGRRCFSGITTLKGSDILSQSLTGPCPMDGCAADWQLAFDSYTSSVDRFHIELGSHHTDISTLHGDSVNSVHCIDEGSNIILDVESHYTEGASVFEWKYDATQVSCADIIDGTADNNAFVTFALSVVILGQGAWGSKTNLSDDQLSMNSFEVSCLQVPIDNAPTTPSLEPSPTPSAYSSIKPSPSSTRMMTPSPLPTGTVRAPSSSLTPIPTQITSTMAPSPTASAAILNTSVSNTNKSLSNTSTTNSSSIPSYHKPSMNSSSGYVDLKNVNSQRERTVWPTIACQNRFTHNDTCLTVFGYHNPNDEVICLPINGPHNHLRPAYESNVVLETFYWPGVFYLGKVKYAWAVLWHCQRFDQRHLQWVLETRTEDSDWVERYVDAELRVDNCPSNIWTKLPPMLL